jgi:hypothetical protein
MSTDDRLGVYPPALVDGEAADFKLFRGLELPPEEFAARYGHEFAMFNFHERNYKRPGMNEWVRALADFFLAPNLPERLRRAREKYLTAEEIQRAEEYERDPF